MQDGFGQTLRSADVSIPFQFESLYNGWEVFLWSVCLLDFCPLGEIKKKSLKDPIVAEKVAIEKSLQKFHQLQEI